MRTKRHIPCQTKVGSEDFKVSPNLKRLRIGLTESLQWVWAPLWIGKWATAESLPVWMNLSGESFDLPGSTTVTGLSGENLAVWSCQEEASHLELEMA